MPEINGRDTEKEQWTVMQDVTNEAFISLFKEAFKKCFGEALHSPLSETECKHFSNRIFDETGLVIGAKSLKNYSFYVLDPVNAKPEKPSVATLDTLARYVLNAPYTDEVKRKEKEAHHPYWYQYRNAAVTQPHAKPELIETKPTQTFSANKKRWLVLIAVFIIALLFSLFFFKNQNTAQPFADDFHTVNEDSLQNRGWFVQSEDKTWWNRRNAVLHHLSLFTLPGDNWSDSGHTPIIKNLLLRNIPSGCFTAEIHLDSFVPSHRWQQAGLLLLEDTNFKSKSLRLSIAYNDFFGGYSKPKEIIVQGIVSRGEEANNPEEIIHMPLFSVEPGQDSMVASNLQKSALRIEKNGTRYRFLYAAGRTDNFAYKEIVSKDIPFRPKYVGLFALQGFIKDSSYLPARFTYFALSPVSCSQ